ncbi:uncharacterized protein LOC117170037 [Belonocnema kinseyi]|uniref:uncharacterized protein LOC117170037 n=1 Tax=Belonocnema kinseyi TaxID=2817044 RepID=UPI00143DA669|nr:uncharacterized protein LOC117170037 [Belonocnema kinseyi]
MKQRVKFLVLLTIATLLRFAIFAPTVVGVKRKRLKSCLDNCQVRTASYPTYCIQDCKNACVEGCYGELSFKSLPNREPIDLNRSPPSSPISTWSRSMSSPARYSPVMYPPATHPPAQYRSARFPSEKYSPAKYLAAKYRPAYYPSTKHRPAKDPPVRVIVPPARLPSNDGNGHDLAEIEFIRLTSNKNQQRIFKFGRFTFPNNTSVKLRTQSNKLEPVPCDEQIVIFTSDGDVFAILETTKSLAGLYMYHKGTRPRAKINMISKLVYPLTSKETKEIPVGSLRKIMLDYRIYLEKPA